MSLPDARPLHSRLRAPSWACQVARGLAGTRGVWWVLAETGGDWRVLAGRDFFACCGMGAAAGGCWLHDCWLLAGARGRSTGCVVDELLRASESFIDFLMIVSLSGVGRHAHLPSTGAWGRTGGLHKTVQEQAVQVRA